MLFEVEMLAFGRPEEIRVVEVPESEITEAKKKWAHSPLEKMEFILDRVYYYGQNDFQPREHPSVSVGDVVRYKGKRYRVEVCGFKQV